MCARYSCSQEQEGISTFDPQGPLSRRKKYVVEEGYGVVYLAVTEVQSSGEMTDLYDFNHDVSGKARDAAILQLGFGNGEYGTARNQGKIFRTRVQFNKTYEALP